MPLQTGQLVTYATHMKPAGHDIRDIYNFSVYAKGLWIGKRRPNVEPFLVVSCNPGFRGLTVQKSYYLTVFMSEGKLFEFISSEDPEEHFVVQASI